MNPERSVHDGQNYFCARSKLARNLGMFFFFLSCFRWTCAVKCWCCLRYGTSGHNWMGMKEGGREGFWWRSCRHIGFLVVKREHRERIRQIRRK